MERRQYGSTGIELSVIGFGGILVTDETPEEEPEGSWKTVLEVFKNPTIWILGGVYFFLKPTR